MISNMSDLEVVERVETVGDFTVTIQKKEEIRLQKLGQERIQANLFKAVGDLKQEVNNPGEQNPETHLTPAEIAAVKAQALTIVKEENFKHIASGLDVNQPTLPHGLGSIFVTPPKILKRQLTGYCTSLASSPMGRDNKHGWYEEHEKFVAVAAGSLSSVLLVGDSLVNGLARYHSVVQISRTIVCT